MFLFPALALAQTPAPRWKSERLSLSVAEATLKVPVGNVRGRLPALLVFGGFQEAGKVLELVHPGRPVILASFDYPYRSPRKFHFPESLRHAPEVKQALRDTLRGIAELKAALLKRPDVDPGKLSILGASFGAPFALAAAAESSAEPDFAGVILVHGFGDVTGTARHQLLRSWKERFGFWTRPLAWLLTEAAWSYLDLEAPEAAARRLRAGQHVFVITAENDSFVPRQASEALWSALVSSRASAGREIMPGDHLQPGSGWLIERILGRVTQWMESRNLL
ncbi:MAG: prolyl oligopeptidase family serine peptidase [Oligoflexia bacterium]|nr:prolyl oligopeptidase family serine peptidase [Oligoflexia bacterium]